MSRLQVIHDSAMTSAIKQLYEDSARRSKAAPAGNCPVGQCAAYAWQCLAQTCGKCVPCRVGLTRVAQLLDAIEAGTAKPGCVGEIERLLNTAADSADCAIGYAAADALRGAVKAIRAELEAHVAGGGCTAKFEAVPCMGGCPAHVDIPGYIALTRAGRYADAVRVIRQDNPFPAACALICEHPCEAVCRRGMIDSPVNIRGIKRSAIEGAGVVPPPECLPRTGKKVAVIGGGPSGLTAAYFLQRMGHQADVFEQRAQLGGMMRYGIPRYRLPNAYLDADIQAILDTGVTAKLNCSIDGAAFNRLKADYDAVYIAIGAHAANSLGIEGENAEGVLSAVELLRAMGDNDKPDFAGKRVVIVGGGNVAMDCTRTAMRLGAKTVTCVYRRRKEDMTALVEEVDGAIAETCELMTMMAPVRIETDAEGKVAALIVQPQIPGAYDRGRPKPVRAERDEVRVECDIVVAAIGQAIDSEAFAAEGIPTRRGRIQAKDSCAVDEGALVFSGGDCASGPSTVIRAVEAGKTAAANIDEALGFCHKLPRDVEIPWAANRVPGPTGRVDLPERPAAERKDDFTLMEGCMTHQEMLQECSRCLRCDHHGMGSVKGGRESW
ncbi:MAG: FAD-dependent oxidoreductase [Clostridia bacterium]|nr:FAD-dependent oxidoreductase [Clostridia bacterium]